jgi:isopentenyl diphosphate isomerase/L-lactate dehydrogenase-like FMN-dependent dehydrogenase
VSKPHNVEGYRRVARRKVPRAIFDYIDGGSEDEVTLRANHDAFSSIRLRPRIHEDESPVDLSTSLCDQPMRIPLMLSPVGNNGMIHHDGDRAGTIVAASRGMIMLMSGGSSYSIEEVAEAADPKPWYQMYPWVSREFFGPLIDRAGAAGFRGLAVTVDTPVPSIRERDIANAFTHPPRLTHRNAFDILRKPRWTAGVLRHRRVVVKLFGEEQRPPLLTFVRVAKRAGHEMAARLTRVTWDDLAWIRERWHGPLGVKGIVDPDDARRAVELGAQVIFVSNHGGRQLDCSVAAVEALPSVVDAVGARAEVVLDGGIRRGTDVVKALCLGARAVSVGRPWAYGLASDGAAGVDAVLAALEHEIDVCMNLLGQPNVQKLDRSYIVPTGIPEFREWQTHSWSS